MFFNLAWRNSKRNRSENLIYFLTMVTAIATFYIVLSLGSQDVMRFLEEIESDAVNRLLTMLMPTVYLFSLLFVFFLVIFANKYQLECRSRELGLYLMFGMTKRHLFIQIMAEGLITSLLALLGGLICGGFLSEVISLATARLVGRGIIAHQSSFSVSAVLLTTLGFLMIQVVALFILCGKLFNKEIHQLLYGEMAKKQQVGKMSGNLFSLILGAVVLTLAYWVKYAVKDTAPTIQFSVTDNPESGQITLSVSDNGTGIPASDLPFVFDKGFTGDAGSFLSRSTGMGLYLVQKMAKDLAIDLQITSQLSCGTTIILMFPKVQYPVRRFDDATADSYANTKEK